MVRSIVGTLVDVGRGRLATDQVATILAARDRNAAGDLAPPQGLCLHEVGY
jgi:tRNA pseudouridine38-40 synthase